MSLLSPQTRTCVRFTRQFRWSIAALGSWLVTALVLFGCSPSKSQSPKVRVFAASSLTEGLADVAAAFQARTGVSVSLQFAGSHVLRTQLAQGAPADVFVSADPTHLAQLHKARVVGPPADIAVNRLTLITPLDDPAQIATFQQLTQAKRLLLGTPASPFGRYAQRLIDAAALEYGPSFAQDVTTAVVSRPTNVRLATTKVAMGEADAAIVYRTDAIATAAVREVPIPDSLAIPVMYQAAIVTAGRPDVARRFLDFLRSPTAQDLLHKRGFAPMNTADPATL